MDLEKEDVPADPYKSVKEASPEKMADLDASQSGPGDVSEESALVPQKRRVSIHTAIKLRIVVIVVSVISVGVLLTLGTVTLVAAILTMSSAPFAFALDAYLDGLSSIVLLWRFSGNGGNLYSLRRESIACLILGFCFLMSAIVIMTKSVYSLAKIILPILSPYLWWGSITNCTVCSLLVIIKLYLAFKLESRSIATDAFNTITGAVLAFSTIIGELVYRKNHHVWQIDAYTGMVCSVALLVYGVWVIYKSYQGLKEEKKNKHLEEF